MATYKLYNVEARWGRSAMMPATLAETFLKTIDAISPLDAQLANWVWIDMVEFKDSDGEGGKYPFDSVRQRFEEAVTANVFRDKRGHVYEDDPGYHLLAGTDCKGEQGLVTISSSLGHETSSWVSPFANDIELGGRLNSDPTLYNFDLLRRVLLILAETWEATWGRTSPGDIDETESNRTFRCAWMSYVCPHLAPRVTPPASAIVERRPNGGLFMAATREPFSIRDPQHLAVAKEIEAALVPLDQMPYPIDVPYA